MILGVLILRGCSLVNHVLSSLSLGSHVSQLELGVLECADGLAELLSLFYVSDGSLKSALADAECLCSDTDTSAVQRVHCDVEALALLSQHVCLRDAAVSEDQLISGGSADTHLLLLRTEGEAGSALLNDECGDFLGHAAALLNHAGDRKDHVYVCFLTVGDEDLGSVQNPLFAIQNGLGLLTLCVSTSAGLGQTECTDLSACCQVRKVLLLLLLGTKGEDGIAAKGSMCGNDNAGGAANLGQLLYAHSVGQDVTTLSAVLLGNGNAHKSSFCHLLNGYARELLGLVNLDGKRLNLFLGKLSEQSACHFMLFAQSEIHDFFPPFIIIYYCASTGVLVLSALYT